MEVHLGTRRRRCIARICIRFAIHDFSNGLDTLQLHQYYSAGSFTFCFRALDIRIQSRFFLTSRIWIRKEFMKEINFLTFLFHSLHR